MTTYSAVQLPAFTPERDGAGVKVRADGKGDAWADAHRDLGPTFNMTDVDGMIGIVGFAANTGERLFMEYVPDDWKNRHNKIRRFATVAVFDRKATRALALDAGNRVGLAYYLNLCRCLGQTQPKAPRFFFVIGRDCPPWTMIELNINTANIVAEHELPSMNWRQVWNAIGLTALRQELTRWVHSK